MRVVWGRGLKRQQRGGDALRPEEADVGGLGFGRSREERRRACKWWVGVVEGCPGGEAEDAKRRIRLQL